MRSTATLLMLSSSVSTTPPPLPKHTLPTTNPKQPSKQSKPPPPPSSSSSSHSHRPPLLSTFRWGEHRQSHNRINYYAELASKIVEDGRFEDFFMIVETVTSGGGSSALKPVEFAALLNSELVSKGILSVIESDGGVRNLIKVLTGFQKLGIGGAGAVEVFLFDRSVMEAIGRESMRILKCGGVEEVVDLMETLSGFHISIENVVEPIEVIRNCVNKRNPHAAIRYSGLCTHSDEIFCTAIHEFGKRGDMASALTVFEASKHNLGRVNMYAYRTIIDVCGLCCDHLQSRSIYEELSAENINPNLYVFNSLMNVNASDLSYTMNIYEHMQNVGVTPDMASYNILLKSCCLAARVDLAQEIYSEVECMESTGTLKLDVFTYSTMIKVFADARMWEMALGMKQKMLEAGVTPNAVTWSSLISACAKAGLVDEAFVLFEEMMVSNCMPNSQCFNVLLYACVKAFQYDRAFRLFESWKKNEYGNITNRQNLSQGSLEVSMKVPFRPTTSTYNVLIKACGTDDFRARGLMDEMRTAGIFPNHITWSTLIGVYGGSGDVKRAVQCRF